MIAAVEHVAAGMVKVLGVPVKLSDTPGSVRAAPPALGQHTEQVLAELGLDPTRHRRAAACAHRLKGSRGSFAGSQSD